MARGSGRIQLFASAAAGGLAAFLACQPAQAQAPADDGTIGEVVVTAQRRSEAVQDVPIAITTLSASTLANSGAVSYPDIAVLTPGLQFQPIGATAMPFLRGVGATTSAVGAEAGVSLYVDDVYYSSNPASMMSLNNIEGVAVLRGPQGTLFGRNATGGVVQITTRKPGQTPRFDATLGYGNHDTKDASVYASTPLSDNVAADVALYVRNVDGGWGDDLGTGKPSFRSYDRALRSRWEFALSPSTQLTVTGQISRVKTQGGFLTVKLNPGELGQNERYLGGVIATEGFWDAESSFYSGSRTKTWGVSARLTQDFGFAELRSITAFNHLSVLAWNDFDFTRPFIQHNRIPPNSDTWSQEFQLASRSDSESPLSWVTGVYLLRDASQYDNQMSMTPGVQTVFLNSKQNSKSWSVFAQASYDVTEATKLTAGIRYNRDRREFAGSTATVRPTGAPTTLLSIGDETYPATTFRLGIDHHFTDDVMAYASYTTGFKSGFFSTQALQVVPGTTTALPVNEEKVRAYEVGFKSIFADRKVRLNASAFYYDYTDLQVNAFLAQTVRVTLNAGAAEIYGLDVDGEWRVNEKLQFTLAAEWLHARFTDFPNAPFFTPRTAAPWGLIVSQGNASGNHLTQSPEFTMTLGGNYTVPLAGGDLSLNGSIYYNSGFYFEPMNRLHQGDHVFLNGTVRWTSPDKRYDVALWGRNLTNEKVFASVNPTANGDAAEPREPFTFGVRVGVHY